jgi:uncharacterized protein YozE (UPF0346 family)
LLLEERANDKERTLFATVMTESSEKKPKKRQDAGEEIRDHKLEEKGTLTVPPPYFYSFNDWLERQLLRNDSVGRFARSVKSDPCWPSDSKEGEEYILFRNHLRTAHNDFALEVIADFEVSWEEYQAAVFQKVPVAMLSPSPPKR